MLPPDPISTLPQAWTPSIDLLTSGMSIRARVVHGRIVVDQPVDLPDGTVLDLVVDDEGDELDEEERQALHDRLHTSAAEAADGKLRPLGDILVSLRAP